MTSQEQKKAGFITLKEASERFGYSPDYIGQLIRKGKLEGKQVYANVAWMTTPEAMEEYLAKEKRTGKGEKEKAAWTQERLMQTLLDRDGSRVLSYMLYVILVILSIALLVLFYFLSVALDHRMQERAKARLIENTPTISLTNGQAIPVTAQLPERELLFSALRI
ncbi:MAG: hypothetical protein A2845_05095 [Candidatus Lloydbacteria bacterium RIFCSPHIGHO2_01_FULL_49_22]|uniref:Helix-turn-helix domain-containing protein n=1 Tax=Candidatus Lloydbacteria bacterium RIFCSPHIGHO2_01_FULL_49_22 TaxID=1798658 RepID=A0A1G2CTX5_9BACT|nr:MAG: hypothetical protein A2845_05095 [Candidatus Lloydbacteria bacterium RIFCSPHIGHO2_01_FULL_49_22]OGZ09504.1 MAG: hypothetical protein A3C14_01650 [Candidatus Lloydbacteria bacterium RIFCSPHIGHO2_02_FULL_50_18]